ncbi:hypothetical protein MKZ08_16795 [Viridibacillus sp. FSL R5-0477]|uniref:Coupling factor for flagellin transcription and translation n=1 Tax=Viridibacillus arenosi FSL R5-213 TaxID=1227360 RepID=W4F096_9BACL|nr:MULTISPECIES: hypothetical protein [Viridibacillus]ETT85884.1 hypothetical protein C176_10647 [Viridibacillus arenosi FSL R5-213]OMC82868.1 hypothetical protein BK130_08975 [Viridibacillus sp. FSL H8-0123]OMC88787.1 hypothetical protein BK128_02280 [Viridibacillus sp. FSL H7-0596]OMC93415.1 hypothetical protein BK137_02555 [Viridibacillus arenosi]
MVVAILVFLFMAQIISFFLIIMLYTKLSRFKDIEVKQERLKDDMDNAVGAYLAEMRDENNRLIEELSNINIINKTTNNEPVVQLLEEKEVPVVPEREQKQKSEEAFLLSTISASKNVAAKAYKQNQTQPQKKHQTFEAVLQTEKETVAGIEISVEDQVRELYSQGRSIEEIAKSLQKGKTEIELILKFKH